MGKQYKATCQGRLPNRPCGSKSVPKKDPASFRWELHDKHENGAQGFPLSHAGTRPPPQVAR